MSQHFSLSKEYLSKILRENPEVNVTFTKKDGSERVLHCTLHRDVIIPYEKKTERTKQPKEDLLPVWDIDNDGWRTITLDNVLSIEIVGEYD